MNGANWLSFTEVDNQLFYNTGVDNVGVAAAVPEPATWAMMMLGFGALGGLVRSRRSKAAAAA